MSENAKTISTLRHLTIKPFSFCAHNCPYCDSRQELFRETSERVLGLDDWAAVFADANAIGAEYLDISGGEPSLYKALDGLIWEAKRLGWFVSMNSTGTRIPEILDRLEAVCLDQIIISLVSSDSANHDRIRRTEGSWKGAMRAMAALKTSSIRLVIHFIVCRHNYRELPDVIDLAFELGANALSFVYPENDAVAKTLLMTHDDIRSFRQDVVPESLRRYMKYHPTPHQGHTNLANLYSAHGAGGDFASGIYWHDVGMAHSVCDKPDTFALIYSNGDVLPCNAIEYVHSPIVGNVLRDRLIEIWNCDAYLQFRNTKLDFCRLCPIKRHSGIPITSFDNPPYQSPVIRRYDPALPPERPRVEDKLLRVRSQRFMGTRIS